MSEHPLNQTLLVVRTIEEREGLNGAAIARGLANAIADKLTIA